MPKKLEQPKTRRTAKAAAKPSAKRAGTATRTRTAKPTTPRTLHAAKRRLLSPERGGAKAPRTNHFPKPGSCFLPVCSALRSLSGLWREL
jgi:hypothetical protein